MSRPMARVGRGGCMGRWFVIVRVVLVLIIVGLIVTLTGCSSGSPDQGYFFSGSGKHRPGPGHRCFPGHRQHDSDVYRNSP